MVAAVSCFLGIAGHGAGVNGQNVFHSSALGADQRQSSRVPQPLSLVQECSLSFHCNTRSCYCLYSSIISPDPAAGFFAGAGLALNRKDYLEVGRPFPNRGKQRSQKFCNAENTNEL